MARSFRPSDQQCSAQLCSVKNIPTSSIFSKTDAHCCCWRNTKITCSYHSQAKSDCSPNMVQFTLKGQIKRGSCRGILVMRDQLILFFLVNYSSQSLTRRIFVTREELGLLTTLLFVILRRESSESQICDCNKESSLTISQFCFLQAPFLVQEQIIKKSISFAYLRNLAKTKFLYPMNSVGAPLNDPVEMRVLLK